jgi:hypothetical protein
MTFIHCDDYIDDPTQPECLRAFLAHARAPAHGSSLGTPRPWLFADHKGKRVRVVMASRFGDVGITTELDRERGYQERVAVADLVNFAETPSGHARDCTWHCDQFEPDCNGGIVENIPKR